MAHQFDAAVYQKQIDAKAQIVLSNLANKTYQEVKDIVTQITDLPSAKVVMSKMATIILALLKERDLSS